MKNTLTIIISCLISITTFSQAPNWSLTPSNYQYTSTLTGVLLINDTLVNSSNNQLGAFVGGQVRGVATPTNVSGTEMYFITLYSNIASGEYVTFKAYLGNQDSVHNVLDSVLFTSNSSFGNPTALYELHLNQVLIPYFTPIGMQSTNVNAQFSGINLSNFTINNANDTVDYNTYNSTNLNASISGDSLFVTHLGNIGIDSILVEIVDSVNNSFVYDQQYVYFEVTEVNDSIFFDSIYPFMWGNNSNSCIDLSTYLVNTNLDSIAWKVSGTNLDSIGDTTVNWSVNPSNFQYSMNLTIQCKINGAGIETGNYELAAFYGDTVVGFSIPQLIQGKWINFLTVYSNTTVSDITFKLWNSIDSVVLEEQSQPLNFIVNNILGDINTPYDLLFGSYAYTLSNSILCITLFDSIPGIMGSFQVVATEVGTVNNYTDTVTFTVSYYNENQPLIAGIPDQSKLLGINFDSFDLDNFLTELDGDSVLFYVQDTNHLMIQIDANNIVSITPTNATWIGSDTVTFIAMDSTTNMLSDYQQVVFTVMPSIDVFGITDQTINYGGSFFSTDLINHLNYISPDSVTWSVTSTSLNGVIQGNQLNVFFPTSNWIGSDTLYIKATSILDSLIFDIDTAIYTVLPPNSITEFREFNFNVYPIPNNGNFTVNIKEIKNIKLIEIIDGLGKIVKSETNITRNIIPFNLQLDPGIYFVRIITAKNLFDKPIIIH